MTAKAKLVAGTALALLVALSWLLWAALLAGPRGPDEAGPAPDAGIPGAASRAGGATSREAARVALGAEGQRSDRAALRVRARWSWGPPAAGIGVCARQAV